MSSYDSLLEEIKSRIDIVDLISQYVNLKRAGQNFKALCPFHSEKTPSFVVSPAKQIFHCFGCGEGGDIFTFLIKHEGLTYREAVKELASRAGVELKGFKGEAGRDEKALLLKLNRDALTFFQESLMKDQRARGYLEERGIGRDAQRMFSIGFAPASWDALRSYLEGRGYRTELLIKAGFIAKGTKGYYDVFRNRLIFPIYSLRGDVVAFGGRALDDSMPKYLNSPETVLFNKGRVLYGLNLARDSIRRTGYALLMEGYIDVIISHLYGFTNAVAPLGTAITEDHGRLIKRFTDRVVLVFDGDQAGIMAAKRATSLLLLAGVDVRLLCLPEGDDPDSFLRRDGADAFRDLLERPLSIVDFLMRYGKDRLTIARDAIEMLSKIPDALIQGSYIKMLSERLGINEFFIIEELKKVRGRVRRGEAAEGPVDSHGKRPLDEIYIIRLLLQMPERVADVFETISPEDFSDDLLRSIFNRMRRGVPDPDRLLLECHEEEKRVLSEVMLMDDFEEPDKVLRDCLNRMVIKRQRAMLEDLQSQIREAEQKGDSDRLLRLLQLKQEAILKGRRA
jgi:DNA primase